MKAYARAIVWLGLAVALVTGGAGAAQASFSTDVVETTTGPVIGTSTGRVDSFQGIRYAASTAGDNRWTPPVPPLRSHRIIEATAPGATCPQPINQFSTPAATQNEDCLFLNVWRPRGADRDERLPVLFWIHGGALVNGTGAAFDPTVLVETGHIVVVTINYRLGALGWLADAALTDSSGNSGNWGLMDQQLALKWVHDNIRKFGGDPARVTISGESAGGLSTLSNLASPTAKGFFDGAIVESGAYMLFTVRSLAAQEALGTTFAMAVGCSSGDIATCLRGVPVATLLADQGFINTSPTSGVPTLPLGLSQAFGSGQFNQVPVMQGTNLNEGTLFEPFTFDPTFTFVPGGPAQALLDANGDSVAFYEGEIGAFLGLPAIVQPAVAALYPPTNFPNPENSGKPSADEALGQIFTDLVFTCNGLTANQLLSKFVPVYAYEFADPNAPDLFQPLIGFSYGASHASELQYLFDAATLQGAADAAANAASKDPNTSKTQPPPLTTGGTELAAEMKLYWSNFVDHQTPNNVPFRLASDGDFDRDDLAFWPLFNTGTSEVQDLVPGPTQPHPITTFSAEHNCPALHTLGLSVGPG
jgi:para-nitrobenzyl esterase